MPEELLVPLTLVRGDEELLCTRAVQEVVATVRAASTDADVRELAGAELVAADLLDLLNPSLFGDERAVVVRDAQDLAPDVGEALVGYPAAPAPGVHVVVVHAGGVKGRKLADALRGAAGRVVDCPRVTTGAQRLDFVTAEFRRARVRVDPAVAAALLEAVGTDLRELAQAARQLVEDTGGQVDVAAVHRYHRGRPETKGFTVADKAVEGDLAGALEALRFGLAVGLAPVLVTSALAGALRGLAAVASGGRDDEIAARAGVPPFKVRTLRRQLRRWDPPGLAAALHEVALADGMVKGGAVDEQYAVERLVGQVAAAAARGRA